MIPEVEEFDEHIDRIYEGGLAISMLAAMMRVSGTLMRKWLNAFAQPEPHEVARLAAIFPVLEKALRGKYRVLLRLWRVETEPGVSLGTLLSAEHVDLEAVSRVLKELEPSIARYARYDDAPRTNTGGRNPLLDEWPVVIIERD